MRRFKPLLSVFLIILFLMPSPASAAREEKRKVRVGVAVAPSMKTIRGWEGKFKKRLAYASQIFGREFNIEFEPAAFWKWKPKSERKGLHFLLDELMETYKLHGVDMVIGLSRMPQGVDASELRDLDALGLARPFSGYMVIRYPNDPLFQVQEETVLVHELGHVFGAIHTEDPGSIMAPIVEKQIPTRFDATNQDIVRLARGVDFQNGIYKLDARTSQQLIGSYLKLQVYKQPADFYYMMGVFHLNMGNRREALKAWEKVSDIDDGNPQIHYDLGMLYSRLGHHNRAIRELGRAISGFTMAWQRPKKASALAVLGEAYMKEEKYLPAYNALSRALAIDDDNVDIQVNMALVQLRRGQSKTAIRDLKRLVSKNPAHARALSYLGTAYYETGEYREALKPLLQAMNIVQKGNQTSASSAVLFEIYSNLGATYMQLGAHDRALTSYQAACATMNSIQCHLQLGNVQFKLQNWEAAASELATVVRETPENPNPYGPLGVALSNLGKSDQAIAIFQEGLRHIDDKRLQSRLHANIGHLYLQANHADFAQREFRLAVSKDYQNIDAHMGMAMAAIRRNNYSGARQSLRTVLSMRPDDVQARRLLEDVENLMNQAVSGTITIQGRR